jgi:putative molybdopterin biosynthesis protein
MKYPDLHFAGSHDPLLEEIINLIRGDHDVEISFIGSAAGSSSLMIGDADIAGIHLFDPSTNEYNIPFLKNFWLEHKVIVIGGYLREIGFVYKKEIGYINGIDDIISKKLKFINRVGGSGTRILIDYLLYKYSKENNLDISELKSKILGYNIEVKTHEDVIREILLGNFDIGVSLRYFADKYNLSFTPLKWERYDYIILNDRLHKKLIKEFIDVLKPQKLHDIIKKFKGYKIYNNTGKRIYP